MPDESSPTAPAETQSLLPPECGPCLVWDELVSVRDILSPECPPVAAGNELPTSATSESIPADRPRRRRWFSYSLRALLICQLLVA